MHAGQIAFFLPGMRRCEVFEQIQFPSFVFIITGVTQ